jgi:hypothetical protein
MGHIKLEGAVDLHCHYGPDFILSPQLREKHRLKHHHSVTALQAAQEAAAAEMAALVLKAHDFPTPALAFAIGEVVKGTRVFGGIVLDHQVGGLNPRAVEHALRLGAKIVWLPTVASHQDYLNGVGPFLGYAGTGIYTLDENGDLLPVVQEILALIKEHNAIVATGHTTAAEHYAVAREFARRGRVIVTHACEPLAGPHLSKSQCVELAQLGAYIEVTAQLCVSHGASVPMSLDSVAELLHAIGPEQCVLATDYGWTEELPHPAKGLVDYIDGLWAVGVSESELRRMACENGARLLGVVG